MGWGGGGVVAVPAEKGTGKASSKRFFETLTDKVRENIENNNIVIYPGKLRTVYL